jgi:hypothetical protein
MPRLLDLKLTPLDDSPDQWRWNSSVIREMSFCPAPEVASRTMTNTTNPQAPELFFPRGRAALVRRAEAARTWVTEDRNCASLC